MVLRVKGKCAGCVVTSSIHLLQRGHDDYHRTCNLARWAIHVSVVHELTSKSKFAKRAIPFANSPSLQRRLQATHLPSIILPDDDEIVSFLAGLENTVRMRCGGDKKNWVGRGRRGFIRKNAPPGPKSRATPAETTATLRQSRSAPAEQADRSLPWSAPDPERTPR